jgi:hypothetical protein
MGLEESSHTIAVIGLGGDGASIVSSLQASHPNGAQYLTLDVKSVLFSYFFAGYSRDVFPLVQTWAKGEGVSTANWFDANGWYSPLDELPDIFLRNTRRPVMRASLLMWRAKVAQHIERALTNPDVIVLAACSGGSTGSAWIADVSRIAKEVFPEALIRIVLHDGLKSERDLRYVFQKMLVNSFWTLRELAADGHLSRCTAVMESTFLATELIAGMINGDGGFVSKIDEADLVDQVAGLARQIYSRIENFMEMEQFISGRCYSLSEILSENDWNAQAGLLLASAENRLTRHDSNSSYGWSEIKFYSKSDNDLLEIFSPRMNAFLGQDYVALALCDQNLGSDKHSHAYRTLSEEGSCALSGSGNPISPDALNQLDGMKLKIQERLNQAQEQISPLPGYQFVSDLYPKLAGLIDRLLQN